MKRSLAQELGQPSMAKFVGATVAGLAPRIMGIGPSIAIPKLLTKLNLSLDDIDVIELNEAFASMAVYCINKLGIDYNKMNVRGGAIALGHPLGCTGARQVVTGLSECRRQKKRILLTSMCIGTGQGKNKQVLFSFSRAVVLWLRIPSLSTKSHPNGDSFRMARGVSWHYNTQ